MSTPSLEQRAMSTINGRQLAEPHEEALAESWVPRGVRATKSMPDESPSEHYQAMNIVGVDFVDLSDKTPPPREWIVRDWIPLGHVTLLGGKGGVGKSLLAQQLGTAVAAAKEWLGDVPEAGSVVGLFCEDDHDELWRRQADICRSLNVPMAGVGQWLTYDARAGKFNALTFLEGRGLLRSTPLVDKIRKALSDAESPRLLILDNVGQMFGGGEGGENDRSKVTAFCNLLTGIALEFRIGVLLLTHPAKTEGSQYSGSGAWENAVRSRLFLERESEEAGGRVVLKRGKANYASINDRATFSWDRGAFVRADGPLSPMDVAAAQGRKRRAQESVLRALAWLAERKLSASHKSRAGNYLPKLVEKYDLADDFNTAELGQAVDALISDQRIEPDALLWIGENRHKVTGLRATDAQ